jgi:hypothetical protein
MKAFMSIMWCRPKQQPTLIHLVCCTQQPVATPPDSDKEDMLASLALPTRDALPNLAAAVLDILPDIPCK